MNGLMQVNLEPAKNRLLFQNEDLLLARIADVVQKNWPVSVTTQVDSQVEVADSQIKTPTTMPPLTPPQRESKTVREPVAANLETEEDDDLWALLGEDTAPSQPVETTAIALSMDWSKGQVPGLASGTALLQPSASSRQIKSPKATPNRESTIHSQDALLDVKKKTNAFMQMMSAAKSYKQVPSTPSLSQQSQQLLSQTFSQPTQQSLMKFFASKGISTTTTPNENKPAPTIQLLPATTISKERLLEKHAIPQSNAMPLKKIKLDANSNVSLPHLPTKSLGSRQKSIHESNESIAQRIGLSCDWATNLQERFRQWMNREKNPPLTLNSDQNATENAKPIGLLSDGKVLMRAEVDNLLSLLIFDFMW